MFKKLLFLFLISIANAHCMDALLSLVGKSGVEVYNVINGNLDRGIDYQINTLISHMNKEGHFGTRQTVPNSHAMRSGAKRWATFFVKKEPLEFYSSESENEKKTLISRIWEAKSFTCEGRVTGTDGVISLKCTDSGLDVCGVSFNTEDIERPCFCRSTYSETYTGDIALSEYKQENIVAATLANNTKAEFDGVPRVLVDRIKSKGPKFTNSIVLRVKYDKKSEKYQFSTCFPM